MPNLGREPASVQRTKTAIVDTNEQVSRIPKWLAYPLSVSASMVIAVSVCLLTFSLFAGLFVGGEDWKLAGIFGFLLMGFVAVYTYVFRPAPLLKLWEPFQRIGTACKGFAILLIVIAIISLIVLTVSWPRGLVPPYDDLAIFAKRPEYKLNKAGHGYEAVSRFRFVAMAASFQMGWHCGAIAAVLAFEYCLCCGIPDRNERKDRYQTGDLHRRGLD